MLNKLDSVKNFISSRAGKKSILYLIIVIVIIAIGLIWYFSQRPEIKEISIPEKSEREMIIEQQLRELEQLRGEAPPLTEEGVKTQLKELEKLRQGTEPLSQEEIQKQLEELNQLRSK